uniref:Pex2_Pex12 domain-containing protein n=2 Tax=Macrostomum lignano TaxID=282301 RepID=A0A1I8I3K2_9PLAT
IPDDNPTGANAPTAAEAAPQADAASRDRERADQIFGLLQRREGEFIRVQVMHSRQVSVVTCVYRQADLRCSVRLGRGGQQHRRAAALLNGLASLSEAFRLLTVVTREWALSRQLIRRKGALTGYAVALLVLFHMEQGGLVPPSVVRALARGHRKSEVSEALRKWQPEPLSTEQLGEQFCGLVRLYATIGFFASSAVCVLTGRLLDRGGREDPFPGARVSLPCPVSGENAGRTYSR